MAAIDINAGYQKTALHSAERELDSRMDEARELRRRIDEKLETLAKAVPSLLTPEDRAKHEARAARLVCTWIRLQPGIIGANAAEANDIESILKWLLDWALKQKPVPEPKE